MAIRERRKRIYRKRIPYGMQNFEAIIKEDCYYVDKTPFIEDIEDANKYFFYIRPRRFGKSLTISMLENYYDINKKDDFDTLFGKLYIGQYPTPEHNTYLIIHLNFAEVTGNIEDYQNGLDVHCNIMFNSCCDRYARLLPPDTKEGLNKEKGAVAQLRYLCQKCTDAGQRIYLFIDEYDNFTNTILAHEEHLKKYRDQTHGEGYMRQFFNTIKGAAGSSLGRVFVTGVSPVTMDDLTSGFNIGTNYSLAPEFNEMTGFTEEEVREITYYSSVLPFKHSVDELIETIKPWYDNYCFSTKRYGKTTMYNSVMVLNFVDRYIRNDYDSSQRDKQKGEAFVHGFTLAMTSQNQFYRPISELDNEGGYADIFLSPLCDIYKDMKDSYIIELKYCKSRTTDEQLKQLLADASDQITRYADSDMVRAAVKTTKLHKLVVIYRGAEMAACEEIG